MLGVARIAAIQAAKRTAELIPLAHPLPLTHVSPSTFGFDDKVGAVTSKRLPKRWIAHRRRDGGAHRGAVGLLTIYDMCKSVDRGMRIEGVRLLEKSGGKSGHFKAE